MNATLSTFGIGAGCTTGRRRYKTICKTLESGEKVELAKEVLNADDPYDFSESEEAAQAGSPLASDDECSVGEEMAESKMESAAAPMPQMANATLLSAAALAEHKRLKELHAQVRADPRSAVELLKPESIGCDTCHKEKSDVKADSDSESESGSESSSESSSEEEVVVKCVATKKKKKEKCKPKPKKEKCPPKLKMVCEHKQPCNKVECTEAIVKARMAKEQCSQKDTEVTKTYEAWAKSMSQFEQSKNELCGNASSSSDSAALAMSITKSNINAEKLIDEFTAKGGLKIDEKAEKAALNTLVTAIGSAKPVEVKFEHKYIASKSGVAAAGEIDMKRHIQPLTIKVSGQADTAKRVYYLDLSVKPSDAPDSYYRTANKVFQLKVATAEKQMSGGAGALFSGSQESQPVKLNAEVLQKGLKAMTNELSVPVTREAVKKIGELISLIA